MKELPSPHYSAAMNNQQRRFEDINQEYPEWKEYVKFGYFSGLMDNLRDMDIDQYRRIWNFAKHDEDLLDGLLHLKWAFKIEGIMSGERMKYWSLDEFKEWAGNFIATKEKAILPISLNDLAGLEGFYEGYLNLKIKYLKQLNFS